MHTNTKRAIIRSIEAALARNLDTSGVASVTITPSLRTIRISHPRKTIPNVSLVYLKDHYAVYLENPKTEEHIPLLSLWSIEDVKLFNKWYALTVKLAARRRD